MSRHTLEYMTRFKCIAERCEDTCCAGMQILVSESNRATLAGALKDDPAQLEKIVELPEALHGHRFALGRDDRGACRYLRPDLLCSVIKQHGPAAVPDACAHFPRNFNISSDRVEVVASLGCPEAARLCLLHEGSTALVAAADTVSERWPALAPRRLSEPYDALYDEVHTAVLGLLSDRAFPVQVRLFQLAELAAALQPVFHRGSAAPADQVRTVLAGATKNAAAERLAAAPLDGQLAMQTAMGLLTGIAQQRTSVRFNTLVQAVMLDFQKLAFAREPRLADPNGGASLWPVLWQVFCERRALLRGAFGPWLELGLERYWINDWYRDSYVTSATLAGRAFGMLLKAATLTFLLAGHPALAQLAALKNQRALQLPEQALLEQAFVETVQIFVKHVERDTGLLPTLDAHLAPQKLGIDGLTRAQLFAIAA